MNSDNFSTALPVTRNEPKDDSGYASQEPSPPPNSSRSFTDRAIAKGKSIMPNYIRKPKQLRPYDKPIPQLTWNRFSDLREQYAESLNNLTRGLPNCTSILMTLQVLGENEESAEPWVFIQCNKAVFGKITRFFRESAIRCDFEPPQPDDRFPRLRVCVHPQKPRPLVSTVVKTANAPPQFDLSANSEGNEIYVLKSNVTPGARRGRQIMTGYSHGVRQATMGGFIKTIDSGSLETIYGMTAGHFVFEELYDDAEYSPVSDYDSEYNEDMESFEFDLNFVEANSEDENDVHVLDKSGIEIDEEVNMDEWSRLGKLSMASHNLFIDEGNLDWGLITIDKNSYSPPNAAFNPYPTRTKSRGEQSSVQMSSARGPLNGILHGSWSYIMLPPGKVLVQTRLLSLSEGEKLHVGDSGAWIVDSSSFLRVYGHVVASDVLGRGYVVPIHNTLEDIRKGLVRLFSRPFWVAPAYIMNILHSNDTGTKLSPPKGLIKGFEDHGDADEKFAPLPSKFNKLDSKYLTMKPIPSTPLPIKSPRPELQPSTVAKKQSDAEFSKALTPSQDVSVSTRVPKSEEFKMDKEEEELRRIYFRHNQRYKEKEVELIEAGEEHNDNEHLKDLKDARDVAEKFYIIRKAEVRQDTKLAIHLKKELENLPGYEDYIISSESDTSGPHELSSAHDTKHPTSKKTRKRKIDEEKGSI
ncbi:uncharacterized protein EAF02_007234 [Botrytis sinoallii]|uniref:uncharacterized protein n=1 Tax=Botrytis sinoallii TaxID=1463999 RepID=UPI00190042D0|nr:uncharacterized protein EAF02_007234 [Botrytis sinoallii]KAF7880388.1 hypothetical protein EAF02_007234 [Botrytis sinoallii]